MSSAISSPRLSYQRHTPYWLLLLPALAVISLFVIKYQVGELNRQVAQLENDLSQLGDRERVLQTEWTYLNRPEYLQKLNDRFHHLQAPSADQMVDWAEVTGRLDQVHQNTSHLSDPATTPASTPANDNSPNGTNATGNSPTADKPAITPAPSQSGAGGANPMAADKSAGAHNGGTGHNNSKTGGMKP